MKLKTTKKAANEATAPADPPPDLVARAIRELGIDTPYYNCRVVGHRLEFTLYNGAVVTWPQAGLEAHVGARSPRPGGK